MGVAKNATPQEIRKAFRKSYLIHPDKGPSPKKLREFQEAYEVLSDPEKRNIYDKYGERGLKEYIKNRESGYEHFDPLVFNKIKSKETHILLNITLEDAYNGGRKEVEYNRTIICPNCIDIQTICSKCNGKGNILGIIKIKIGNCIMQDQKKCDKCNGLGKIIKEKCKECGGKIMKTIKRKIGIDLEKGVPDGHIYKIEKEGNEDLNIETGDLTVEIILKKHKDFTRKGADLFYKCEISLLESLTGVKFIINHLNGKKILIYSNPGEIISPSTIKTVEGLGMPFFNSPNKYGNLFVDFQIIFPEILSDEQCKKFAELLNNKKIHQIENLPKDIEKYSLKDYDESKINSGYKGGKKEDNNDENVKCNNQ